MLRIDHAHLEAIFHAEKPEDLHDMVQSAIQLEFATIPPYLTAMISLKPGQNREIWGLIHEVVIEEMLHMTIASNIMNAIGGRPTLAAPDFLPKYPGPLPMGIGDLTVPLEKFSTGLMRRVFMEIEEPEKKLDIPVVEAMAMVEAPEFATIGAFYTALKEKIGAMGDAVIIGDPARQVVPTEWFGDDIYPITTAQEAVDAINLIIEEGEGAPHSPFDPSGDLAHFYKFWEIAELRHIEADETAPDGFSFSGPVIPYDPDGVWDITPNQTLASLDKDSLAGRRASQFSFVFTKLMTALEDCFDGDPSRFDVAMGLMFELKLAGQMLVQLPAVSDGIQTGLNAGPVFEYSKVPT